MRVCHFRLPLLGRDRTACQLKSPWQLSDSGPPVTWAPDLDPPEVGSGLKMPACRGVFYSRTPPRETLCPAIAHRNTQWRAVEKILVYRIQSLAIHTLLLSNSMRPSPAQ